MQPTKSPAEALGRVYFQNMTQTSPSERERTLELARYLASISIVPGPNPPSFDSPRQPPDPTLVALSQLGALKLDCSRSFISLIDRHHQYIISEATKSNSLIVPGQHAPNDGIYLGFSALELSFGVCPQTIEIFTTSSKTIDTPNITADKSHYIIRDFCADADFSTRPYVTGWPHLRSYAEVPLTSASGFVIGSYCVIDDKPRAFDDGAISVLHEIASTIMNHLELLKMKVEHERVERLVSGLGSYVNGAPSIKAPQTAVFRTLSGPQTSDNPQPVLKDSTMPSRAPTKRTDTSTASVTTLSSVTSPSNASYTPLTAIGSDQESVNRKASPTHRSSYFNNQGHSDQASIVAEGIRKAFARAGNIIREAMDMQGVLFVDPSSRDFGDFSGTRTRPSTERRASVSESMFVKQKCTILTYSTETENFPESASPPAELPEISQGLLKRLLLRYPFGHAVSSDEFGVLSTPRIVRGFPDGDGFAQLDLSSRTAAEDSTEMDDAAELFLSLPHARSVVFLPIWDFQKDSWFSVVIGWTTNPVRIFDAGDIEYLSTFGNSIKAEASRLEAVALSSAKGDFISSISHELRSPLHGILAGTELLRESMTQTSESAMLDNIDACGNMLLDTMNHLLDYAKINSLTDNAGSGNKSSSTQKRMSVVDLGELVLDVLNGVALGHSATQKPAGSTKRSSPDGIVVLADIDASVNWKFETEVGAWKRIVMNIVDNSLKYTDRGRVEIKLFLVDSAGHRKHKTDTSGQICIQVVDTGRGMSSNYLRHGLFKPFAQENNLSTGTGLGLSIVQRLVESLNGSIEIKSRHGSGTWTDVLIPIGEKTRKIQGESYAKGSNSSNCLDPQGTLRGRTLYLPVLPALELPDESASQLDAASQQNDLAIRRLLANIAQDWLGMSVVESIEENVGNSIGSIDTWALLPVNNSRSYSGSKWTLRTPSRHYKDGEVFEQDGMIEETVLLSPFSPRNVALAFLNAQNIRPKVENSRHNKLQGSTESSALVEEVTAKPPTAEDPLATYVKADLVQISGRTPQDKASGAKKDRPKHVLIVDDNDINVNVLIKVAKAAGCTFAKANNGLQAVEQFTVSDPPFDLVFMDLSMPVMDGCTATRQIRDIEASAPERLADRVQIVALTALGSDTSKEQAFESGVDMFLTKPVPMKEVKLLMKQKSEETPV